MKTIHDQWQDFCDAGGRNMAADEYQLRKMQCAFYAGATGVIEVLHDMVDKHGYSQTGYNKLDRMWQECEQFAQTCSAQN